MKNPSPQASDKRIRLPYNFFPRPYQLPLCSAIDNGVKRIFVLFHRRAGKDLTLWNMVIKKACEKVGTYYYLLPTFVMAKRIIWEGKTNDGRSFMDFVPKEIIKASNQQELKLELFNGSIIQLIGTDNYNAIRGTNPCMCVFSEYAYQDPMAWEVIKPILKMNNGVAIFNTTPQGHNHAYTLWQMAVKNPDWFTQKITVADTKLLTEKDILDERTSGMTEDMIQQEYYCSWEAAIRGAFYADEIRRVKEQNRISKGIYNKDLEVYTAWDHGLVDDTAIVFYQVHGREVRIIDYYSNSGMTLPEYIVILKSKPYRYTKHYFPWDARVRALSSGKSSLDVAREYGLEVEILPNVSVMDGIQQMRMVFDRCWFEDGATEELLNCLSEYKREWDDDKKVFRANPVHDWTSHGADAARYMALSLKDKVVGKEEKSGADFVRYLQRGERAGTLEGIFG